MFLRKPILLVLIIVPVTLALIACGASAQPSGGDPGAAASSVKAPKSNTPAIVTEGVEPQVETMPTTASTSKSKTGCDAEQMVSEWGAQQGVRIGDKVGIRQAGGTTFANPESPRPSAFIKLSDSYRPWRFQGTISPETCSAEAVFFSGGGSDWWDNPNWDYSNTVNVTLSWNEDGTIEGESAIGLVQFNVAVPTPLPPTSPSRCDESSMWSQFAKSRTVLIGDGRVGELQINPVAADWLFAWITFADTSNTWAYTGRMRPDHCVADGYIYEFLGIYPGGVNWETEVSTDVTLAWTEDGRIEGMSEVGLVQFKP